MNAHGGAAGFRVPDYQRQYDWSTLHLSRLLHDCLDGFHQHCEGNSGDPCFAYLGSIILNESTAESTFPGVALDIVDGQQRLTSLMLLALSVHDLLSVHSSSSQSIPNDVGEWLRTEVSMLKAALMQCIVGQLPLPLGEFPFPRIIRTVDHRARSFRDAEYRSPVALLIAESWNKEMSDPVLPVQSPPSDEATALRLEQNHRHITRILERYVLGQEPDRSADLDDEVTIVPQGLFRRRSCRSLFTTLRNHPDGTQNRFAETAATHETVAGLSRLVLFASYLTHNVILTRVETAKEEDALAIFDALNTTGEPLTALETCKPLVVSFEERERGYVGSESEIRWTSMEIGLIDAFSEPAQRQKEIKELVTAFALYLSGERRSQDLVSQRRYMRQQFESSMRHSPDVARKFVRALEDLTSFRLQVWARTALPSLVFGDASPVEIDLLRLCLHFLVDMRTTLAMPILARYWVAGLEAGSSRDFVLATKAIAAFLAMRRSVTRGTAGIDDCFRGVMAGTASEGQAPLCLGDSADNPLLPLDALKASLLEMLSKEPIGVDDRDSWVSSAVTMPHGDTSTAPRPLCRFLLLAAAGGARPEDRKPGLLSRADPTLGSETRFMLYENWVNQKYRSVEHIAPVSAPKDGWSRKIYENPTTKHLLGNLVLLPERENQSIGNASWSNVNRQDL
ncbi:MAG: DUF262 domain-containing protein [Chloroflexi bacterium]|nr:DUF262 domain-containing protein [Chloroflexota bacterium]